ncbi:MAG: hypothetical protein KDE54_02430 [Caldilineaceae bacterium]|nr:hypothetical protein [Caldilineaceae bacterium]MCB0095918.1 hypothetical protein [Caldilineaceae bacterium]MCB0140260.1 hypothetical protein [Caldilineaceae bacterium]
MALTKLKPSGDSAVLPLPKHILEQLGLGVNDEIDIVVIDKALIVRSISEAERAERVKQATDKVFEKYDRAFATLAEGAP